MMNRRLSSALRDLGQHLSSARARGPWVDRLLERRKVPLRPALDAARHEIQTADAGTISYYADTSGSGRPLVLLHGIHAAASSYEMRPLFESFRGERPVYALDLPGFGFSERGGRSYSPATYVHAIEHLLRNVAVERGADVVALSLTSEYAAKVAVEMPELVRSLVLLSPTGFAARDEAKRLERWARRRDKRLATRLGHLQSSRLLYELLVSRPSLRFFLQRNFEGRIDDGLLAYAYATSHQPGAARAPLAFLSGGLFPSGSGLNVYAHVRAPSLVLHDKDPYTGFGELPEFVAKHVNFQQLRIPHTRGLPQFDAPQQTIEALRDFWRGNDITHPISPGRGFQGSRFIGSA
ncbi:MAG: alpha/beta fold hydrolase [Polyangiales bacterium]